MKINVLKQAGGVLVPYDDEASDDLNKFKTGELYQIDIKLTRNPAFLRKTMAFFKFCMEHYDETTRFEFASSSEQFDRFRKDLTILAGFYTTTTRMNGDVRIEAESLSFASMKEERFEIVYNSLIRAAMKHVFRTADESTYNELLSYF